MCDLKGRGREHKGAPSSDVLDNNFHIWKLYRQMASYGHVELAPLFHALAEPKRVEIVRLLSSGPRRAGALSQAVGVAAPAMSKHLRLLLDAGIVADERASDDARGRVFRLRPESMGAIQAWLDRLQAEWDAQLASFKAHVEGKR
jgi:DNA-binding transcriptional ArsR family regulator